jgi:ribosomal-protein-alanine N-acetyltransferase
MMGLMDFFLPKTEPAILPLQAEGLEAARLREAADIHAAGFARGWTDGEIEKLLSRPGTYGLAAQAGAKRELAGFILYTLAADEAEILTIATAPHWRKQGVGEALVKAALLHVSGERAKAMFLEVGDGNAAALRLYRKLGFREVGRRRDYYGGASASLSAPSSATALVMRRDLA